MNTATVGRVLGSAALSFALIGSAAAQNPPSKPSEMSKPGEPSKPVIPPAVVGTMTLGVTVAETELVATGWRASKLIRTQVYNDTDQKIGKVDDLIVAPDGSLTTAIVDVGGFLGIGAHKVAIPVKQFKQIAPKVILPGATKEALKTLPEFKYLQSKEAPTVPPSYLQ